MRGEAGQLLPLLPSPFLSAGAFSLLPAIGDVLSFPSPAGATLPMTQQSKPQPVTIKVVVLRGCDNCGNPIDDPQWMLCERCRTPQTQVPQSEKQQPPLIPAAGN